MMSRSIFRILVASSLLGACASEAPALPDSGISFTPIDSAMMEVDSAVPAPLTIGRPCTLDSECPEGAPLCLTEEQGFPGGHCTQFCVSDGIDGCPEGSRCTPIAFMAEVCLAECDQRLERPCRPGYGCGEAAPAAPVCAAGCDVDDDCFDGLHCNRNSGGFAEGRCFDPTAAITDPCTEVEQCNTDGWCIPEGDRGWPGGACTVFNCNEVDDTGCPDDAHCVFGFYRDPICVDGCTGDADCRPGYACASDETYPDRLRCTPSCSDDAVCTDPETHCDTDSGRCAR